MNLLLLLTALFASLTGIGAADPAAHQVEGRVVVRAVEVTEAVAQPSRHTQSRMGASRPTVFAQAVWPLVRSVSLASARLPFERRLE